MASIRGILLRNAKPLLLRSKEGGQLSHIAHDHGHPELKSGETLLWSAWTEWGDENSRPVGGHLLVTDQRIMFRPSVVERVTGEHSWECSKDVAKVTIGPGDWVPHIPVVQSLALRGKVTVACPGYEPQSFFFLHPADWLKEHMQDLPIHIEAVRTTAD
jgi:hypothetical protein